MRFSLIGLAGEKQQDTEVGLRVEVLGLCGNYCGEFRNRQIRAFFTQILICLLLMSWRLRRGR